MRWTAKFRSQRFPEFSPIFQHHLLSSLGMCYLLISSWTSPLSLHLKVPAAAVSLRHIFSTSGAFTSSGFSYSPVSLRANLVDIAAASSLAVWSNNSILLLLPTVSLIISVFVFLLLFSCFLSLLSIYPYPPLQPFPLIFFPWPHILSGQCWRWWS